MRIIAGEYKGRRISSVKGADIRYTADRVKKSLFSILRDKVIDARFLDIFAGSGNVGIESISRGASEVTFVDANPVCIKAISQNLAKISLSPNSPGITLLKMNMSKATAFFNKQNKQFDIIFLDPPYRKGLVKESLNHIFKNNILADNGLLIAEHDVKEDVLESEGNLTLIRQNSYGTKLLSFYSQKNI
ncbi:16S rRNA (guanine(966)-N(2))-methyltransferase RsmD [Candidatus Poribacteria bacterium]|nr:16S rRNA (guanine(966)-N(2))-methyltransferase RsmD [Candidatus Poribacteria bacterium]